jgi:hypothetical protein
MRIHDTYVQMLYMAVCSLVGDDRHCRLGFVQADTSVPNSATYSKGGSTRVQTHIVETSDVSYTNDGGDVTHKQFYNSVKGCHRYKTGMLNESMRDTVSHGEVSNYCVPHGKTSLYKNRAVLD